MGTLILVRHAKSAWNATGQWTGWTDVPLSDEGLAQAARTAEALRDIHVDKAYTSDLQRCITTLDIILKDTGNAQVPVVIAPQIKERNYGVFTGKNKWEIKKEVGDDTFTRIRRSWDEPIPEGETLKDVYARSVPYFEKEILPLVKAGQTIMLVSSGNALRALVKNLEHIGDDQIGDVEVGVAEAWLYALNAEGTMLSKEIRAKAAEHV